VKSVFKHHESVHIVESFNIFKLTILMFKQTSLPVGAVQFLVECRACLGLVLDIVERECLPHQLMFTVSELALVAVSAEADLDPVLAHLGLVFRLIHL
jgi:hypothetical protein